MPGTEDQTGKGLLTDHKHNLEEFYSIDGEAFYVCAIDGCVYTETRHDPCTCPEMGLVGSDEDGAEITCSHEMAELRKRTRRLRHVLIKVRDRLRMLVAGYPWNSKDTRDYMDALTNKLTHIIDSDHPGERG